MRLIFRIQVFPIIACHSLPFSLLAPNYNRFSLLHLRSRSTLKEQERVFPKYCLDIGQHLYLFIFKSLPVLNHTVVPFMFEEQKYLERALKVSKGQHTTRRRHSWRPESKGDQGWPPAQPSDFFGKQISCYRPVFYFCLMVILSLSLWLFMRWLVDYVVTRAVYERTEQVEGGRDFKRVKSNEKTKPKLIQN